MSEWGGGLAGADGMLGAAPWAGRAGALSGWPGHAVAEPLRTQDNLWPMQAGGNLVSSLLFSAWMILRGLGSCGWVLGISIGQRGPCKTQQRC